MKLMLLFILVCKCIFPFEERNISNIIHYILCGQFDGGLDIVSFIIINFGNIS